jgi:dynein intermediate chain
MVTYSKGTQTTTSTATSTDDPDFEVSDDEGRRRKQVDDGSGRETEDEMRKRILEELEVERKDVERELKELRDKEDAVVLGE